MLGLAAPQRVHSIRKPASQDFRPNSSRGDGVRAPPRPKQSVRVQSGGQRRASWATQRWNQRHFDGHGPGCCQHFEKGRVPPKTWPSMQDRAALQVCATREFRPGLSKATDRSSKPPRPLSGRPSRRRPCSYPEDSPVAMETRESNASTWSGLFGPASRSTSRCRRR